MRKLRVGIWLEEGYVANAGGGFSYFSYMIDLIKTYSFEHAEIIFLGKEKKAIENTIHKNYFFIEKYRIKTIKNLFSKKIYNTRFSEEASRVVDVIYYLVPSEGVPHIEHIPFIYTLWDLGHITTYPFPEIISTDYPFEKRKLHHEISLPKALMIIAESETGKKQLLQHIPTCENKIRVIPMPPSPFVYSKSPPSKPVAISSETYFIHYPAQFWAHKNHYNLIIAFKNILQKHPNLKLVLTGSDKGNKKYISDLWRETGIAEAIIDLGFISADEMKWLYLNSAGLVMPTFLGPTNIPVLDAKILGCPVACSDLTGHREQIGEYGIYFNPAKPEEIEYAVLEMLTRGKSPTETEVKFNDDSILQELDKCFFDIARIRFCWQ
jgi:glycosyltransferase involved in cell wall biosynthesis